MDHRKPNPNLYGIPFTSDAFNDMPYRYLGNSGLRVSNVGLGTWKMGHPHTGDGSRTDEKTSLQIFDRAIELGVTFWDTANRYNASSGNSERVIGTWLDNNPNQRRDVILATKLFGAMDGTTPNHCRLARTNILESLYASLERLNTDYIDLLYFHSFDPITPIDESLDAIEDLTRQDLVRYFGASNFTTDQLTLYSAAEKSSRSRIIAVQNRFDIINNEDEKQPGVLQFAAQNNISFVPFSPLARGLLTEKYLDPSTAHKGDRLYDENTLDNDTTKQVMAKLNKLAELTHSLDLKLNQLAIAHMLTLPGMGPVIASVSSVEQLESNALAGTITLTDEQISQIKQILT